MFQKNITKNAIFGNGDAVQDIGQSINIIYTAKLVGQMTIGRPDAFMPYVMGR